jgi:hypothetical protein
MPRERARHRHHLVHRHALVDLSGPITVTLVWGGTAGSADYTVSATGGILVGTALTLAAGVSSATVRVTPVNDSVVELTESVTLGIAAGSGYTVGSPSSASASILGRRPARRLDREHGIDHRGQPVVEHGDPDRHPVGSDLEHGHRRVGDGQRDRDAGSDYAAGAGTLTFAPGVTSQTISVTIYGDRTKEANETFRVTLGSPANATLGNATATVTIVNDDGTPLTAASAPSAGTSAARLTAAELRSVVARAKVAWLRLEPGADLGGIRFTIADLDGLVLARPWGGPSRSMPRPPAGAGR